MRIALPRGIFLCAALAAGGLAHAQTRILFTHLAPIGATPESTQVSVRINNLPVTNDLRYANATAYTTLAAGAGTYQVEIFQPGQAAALVTQSITLAANTDYSMLLIGDQARRPIELQLLTDTTTAPAEGRFKVRFVHAAPFATSQSPSAVNLLKDEGEPLQAGVGALTYKQITDFVELPFGVYNLKVMNADSSRNLVDLSPQSFAANARVTIAVSGNGFGQPLGFVSTATGRLTTEPNVDHLGTAQWFSLTGANQGFSLNVVPQQDRLLGGWFTHDTTGTGPIWFGLDSCNQNTALGSPCATPGIFNPTTATTLSVYRLTGARFNQPTPNASTEKVGSATIQFTGCNTATFTYILNPPFLSGTMNLLRVGTAIECGLQ
jgi:Domain of unknown function (DUF4397)